MKLSRILLACLVAAVGSSAYAAKFNLKMGHAVNATDGQHAAALNKQFVALVKPGVGEMRDATLVDISPDLRLRSAGPQQSGERRCKQRGHSQGLYGLYGL